MQTKHIAYALTIAVLLPIVVPNLAYAQYGGAAANSPALEDQLKLAREKVQEAQANPGAGSGTPFLAANGMVTAMIISAVVFGALFLVCVLMAKSVIKKRDLELRK